MGLRSCAGGTPTPPAAAHSRLNQCSGVTCSPPKIGGVPQRGEGVCTASKGMFVLPRHVILLMRQFHTPPSLRDTPSILEGEQVTTLRRL